MEFPHIFVFDSEDEDDAATDLAARIHGLEIEAPFVLSSVHGERLASKIASSHPTETQFETPASDADQAWAGELGSRAKASGADAIVAVGGGRCLDLGKLAAARAGLTVIAVPTQLSHDGICSPVAVVPNEEGLAESLGAIAPIAVFVSLPTVVTAPAGTVSAGLGDLLANPLALRDWALAAERGIDEVDHRAWDMSVESFELIEPYLDTRVGELANNPTFFRHLADSLVLSGMSMIYAGTSRPASGAEHEVSHAIDELYGGKALHGAQVAFGCIVSVALYGENTRAFRVRLRKLGLPDSPDALGLSRDEIVEILLRAPETRPGRFTILEETNLDRAGAGKLVDDIWGED
jgi:glycerol-1-phosphate dehydrogenase [NAD(P)+]